MDDQANKGGHINENKRDLEIIYTKYYDLLLNYGIKLYPDAEIVKDCIQDLFVKLYTSKNIRTTVNVRSYLLKSIRNILIDRLSKNKLVVSENQVSFHMPVDETELETAFGKNDEDMLIIKKLLHSFEQLSDKQKQIIYFRYIQELSHKEIADILEINEQSSMNLSSRALAKLRQQLNNTDGQVFISHDELKKGLVFLLMAAKRISSSEVL